MSKTLDRTSPLTATDLFIRRHIGPSPDAQAQMLKAMGLKSLDDLEDAVIPRPIRLAARLDIPGPRGESELLKELRQIAEMNEVRRPMIGMGYSDCVTPPVILRNVFENPGWYTQYTPYQAEISQGRLEALLNFQTMVADLTGFPLANASLLDEATAAAEGLAMCRALSRANDGGFFLAETCHPQTIAVVQTRADALGIPVYVGDPASVDFKDLGVCGILLQYPDTHGIAASFDEICAAAHRADALVVVACDLLSLTLLRAPGEFGADIAVGSSQRFGVPLGYGGPHAAFLATKDEYKRQIPGRIVGVSKDDVGHAALRLAMQTREQHIRRDKATSNICTAQVLLAIMASMYAVYHGPDGLRRIADRVHALTVALAAGLRRLGWNLRDGSFFDTLCVSVSDSQRQRILERMDAAGINLRIDLSDSLGIAVDETCDAETVQDLLRAFGTSDETPATWLEDDGWEGDATASVLALLEEGGGVEIPKSLRRVSAYLEHEVFQRYHSEHEMLRYLNRLQSRDLSLTQAMIPLGSCTMKLNGTSQMIPVSWPEFGRLHPFAPADQVRGYTELFRQLEDVLAKITGFDAVSLQPNAGAQGEYAGLLVIRAYHLDRGDTHRNVCLIPTSAHGTNPASAVMAGMKVVPVQCDDHGNIDLADLRGKAEQHADNLSALMITYPSTHGVFEASVKEVCEVIHSHGGQVYMDGANMNAQVGLCSPGDIGADVCHLNLHKTFCIPHGGGGPGMGPIGVAEHLAPFLPGHPVTPTGGAKAIGPVSATAHGSASILPISWVYIFLMGEVGLRQATEAAILNANYMAQRLSAHYPILYTGRDGRVAHEFILDVRPLKASAGITVEDIAKRLIDYGFHAPTMSWPVAGTLMVEPTESESLREVDRFCDAMIQIRQEIREIEEGRADPEHNLLKRAPHTALAVLSDSWDRPYGREEAAFPTAWQRETKFWPAVGRVDNAYGDRNLVCSCPPMDDYAEER